MIPIATPAGNVRGRSGRRRGAILALLVAAGALVPGPPTAAAATGQRGTFLAAERALRAGQIERFRALSRSIRDYPLYPYLAYAELRRGLAGASAARVDSFLEHHADTPLASRLRQRWLALLARRGRWQAFLDTYQGATGARLRCQHARALLETGRREAALAEVPALWLVGRSQPPACDPAFRAWIDAGGVTPDLAWKRLALAARAGRPSLARYLARFLDPGRRALAERWMALRRHPETLRSAGTLAGPPDAVADVLSHLLRRLGRRYPERAAAAWEALRERHAGNPTLAGRAARELTLAHARAGLARGLAWLDRTPPAFRDAPALAASAVLALRLGRWERMLEVLESMGPEQAAEPRWRYWRARALEHGGRPEAAAVLFRALAADRGYYSFLAADRLGQDYRFGNRPLDFAASELDALARRPGLRRARELLALGRRVDARREWRHVVRALEGEDLARAAKLAQSWDWHGRAILTVARTPYLDDLALRFPLAFRDRVERAAAASRIEPAWVFAVVRQESAFMPDARSPKGALGLMQIMPATGRGIARRLSRRLDGSGALLQPETSLRFGTTYLRELLDRLDGHGALATAAYNAGIHRVRRWRPEHAALPADVWIETVPFRETRRYLRRVLAYTAIYEHRLGLAPTRISDRLRPVGPRRAGRGAPTRPATG